MEKVEWSSQQVPRAKSARCRRIPGSGLGVRSSVIASMLESRRPQAQLIARFEARVARYVLDHSDHLSKRARPALWEVGRGRLQINSQE